ncbi:MAG: hypothetical protein RI964_2655 [Pseudomonadota bacterium]|jgi:hypothetical protein
MNVLNLKRNVQCGVSVLVVISLLTGCGGGSNALAAANNNAVNMTAPVLAQPLTASEIETLLFVREEEKMARDVYLTLYERWGDITFQNIALRAEQTHMERVKALLDAAGVADPVMNDAVGVFSSAQISNLYTSLVERGNQSLVEALQVGGFIEEFDIKDLQEAIAETQLGSNQTALVQVYNNLMKGSRNHLRAFVTALVNQGITYQAQVLEQTQVDAIVNTEWERGQGAGRSKMRGW